MNFDHVSDKRLITGTSGTGKSTLLIKLIRKEAARIRFIYDHQGEYERKLKLPSCRTPDQLCAKTSAGGYVIFDPIVMFPGRSVEGFEFFCDFVFEVSAAIPGRKLFVVDELQKLTGNREEPAELLAVIETGRRFQVDCLFISQAPNRIHNAIRNQLTEVYTFRQSDANAIAYLEQNGFPADQVRNLARFKYLWRNLDSGEQNFDSPKPTVPNTVQCPEAQPVGAGDPSPCPAQSGTAA